MLRVSGLSAGYGSFQALFDVSLEVRAGESVAVLGPNGAGKTTLLRAISKLIDASAGEITMEGARLNELPAHEVIGRGITHVPENRRLFPRLTVEENLRMGAFLPSARSRFAERRDFVFGLFPPLEERRAQPAGTLSGGEQQMLTIGRALMARPRLLLLDEPSLGLAPLIARQIFQTIAEIRRQGVAVLLVEQNVHLAFTVADRAYVMETGRVRLQGTPAELSQDEAVVRTYLGG